VLFWLKSSNDDGIAPRLEWSSFLCGGFAAVQKKRERKAEIWRHSKKTSLYNKLTLGTFFAYICILKNWG
jgi:hypothetical protein